MNDEVRRELVEYFKDLSEMFHTSARAASEAHIGEYSGFDRELRWNLREEKAAIYREVGDKFDAIAEKIRGDIGR